MIGLLFLMFLVVPLVELYIIVQVASGIGILETIGLLVLVSVVGAWLVRAQGLGVLGRVQSQLSQGKLPGRELVDGLLILFAGALMLTPGFLTDAFGLLLLLPPTRAIVRTVLIHRYKSRIVVAGPGMGFQGGSSWRYGAGDVTDVGGYDTGEEPPPPIELGPGER
jgi:UPF0716 protein FxsA